MGDGGESGGFCFCSVKTGDFSETSRTNIQSVVIKSLG